MRCFTSRYRRFIDRGNSLRCNGAKHSAALVVFPCIKLVKSDSRR
ncbi:hypothetical protein AK972_1023 [Pseudomonas yamanorum]|nr:hypothetical protein AK972_1023 [Pseudomonas yamanorum]